MHVGLLIKKSSPDAGLTSRRGWAASPMRFRIEKRESSLPGKLCRSRSDNSRVLLPSNWNPILISYEMNPDLNVRQTTRQGIWMWSESIRSVKCSGMPTGEVTSSAAPVSDKFRTVQSMAPPPNCNLPDFNSVRRGAVLCSSTAWTSAMNRDDVVQT